MSHGTFLPELSWVTTSTGNSLFLCRLGNDHAQYLCDQNLFRIVLKIKIPKCMLRDRSEKEKQHTIKSTYPGNATAFRNAEDLKNIYVGKGFCHFY